MEKQMNELDALLWLFWSFGHIVGVNTVLYSVNHCRQPVTTHCCILDENDAVVPLFLVVYSTCIMPYIAPTT